jgi:hypothetical protein
VAARFRPSADALATRVGDEIVLVHLKTDKIFVLNRTGARVWELVSADLDLDEIGQRIEQEFDVTACAASAQISELLDALKNDELVLAEERQPWTR